MKIVVTGGNGFIGSNLVDYLKSKQLLHKYFSYTSPSIPNHESSNYKVGTYTIQHQNGKTSIVNAKQFTQDKDLVIQLLKQDYQDSRDAWWRLKQQLEYYKNNT